MGGCVTESLHLAPRSAGGLESRCLGEDFEGAERFGRGIRDLEVEPASAQAGGEGQFTVGSRPALEAPIKLLVQSAVQPCAGNRDIRRKKGFAQTGSYRDVGHAHRATVAVVDDALNSLLPNLRRRGTECAADFIEMEKGAEPRLREMKNEM